MELTIKLNLDNDAFKGGCGAHDIYRILGEILIGVDAFGEIRPMNENLRDLNGNHVGYAVIDEDGDGPR